MFEQIVHRVEDKSIDSKKFSLSGKKSLLKNENEWSVVIVDVGESPIERPQKNRKTTGCFATELAKQTRTRMRSRGKKKRHTLKS